MKTRATILGVAAVAVAAIAARPVDDTRVTAGYAPPLQSVGTIAFGPPGVMYAADPQGASIYAIEMGAPSGTAGTKAIDGIDAQVAAALGTAAAQIAITDLVVDPRNGNTILAVMRGLGTDAKPAFVRVDGAGKIDVISTDNLKFTSIALSNAPAAAAPGARNNQRTQSVTDMAFKNGRLFVAGLSNEEFASKLYSFAYPFTTADRGTSVEIFHGNHGALETRSPIYAFVPYTVAGADNLIAAYTCTPLVKIPLTQLAPGAKVTGTTIAELGAGNRPLDMIVYSQGGKDFVLMSNTVRGVMKISTEKFATEAPITARVPTGTAGVPFETIASLTGVQQLDKLNATQAVLLVRAGTALNLQTVALP
jgi:hypothetical protein